MRKKAKKTKISNKSASKPTPKSKQLSSIKNNVLSCFHGSELIAYMREVLTRMNEWSLYDMRAEQSFAKSANVAEDKSVIKRCNDEVAERNEVIKMLDKLEVVWNKHIPPIEM